MKKIFFALIALAVAAVSCDKIQPEDPNPYVPETGAQVYIDNASTVFYVRTAEEKAETKAEIAKLTCKSASVTTPEADSLVGLPLIRKNTSGEYKAKVNVLMADMELFTISKVSYEKGGQEVIVPVVPVPTDFDGDKVDDGYAVEVPFADEIGTVKLLIGFDITKIDANKEYKFNASLGDDVQLSSFGAKSLDFVIMHSAPVHNPWVVIGSASNFVNGIYASFWGFSLTPCTVTVAIHEHDFTDDSFIVQEGEKVINPDKTKRTLKDQAYYRFCIPSFGYQNAVASIEAGDGIFEESDLENFETSDGLMFFLEKGTYEFIEVKKDGKTYVNPLADDITTGTKDSYQSPFWSYNHVTGTCSFNDLNDGAVSTTPNPVHYMNIGYNSYWACSHSAQDYDICTMAKYGTSLYYGSSISFTFDKNELESDWANYFKVNYNPYDKDCDIAYIKSATGSIASEIAKGAIDTAYVYEGYDKLYKNNVYTLDAGIYAIAVLVSADGKAKLASDQPFDASALGDKVYASQSDKYLSSVEFNADGSIKSITAGIKLHYQGSTTAIKEYKEVFTPFKPELTIDDFCGSFRQYMCYMESSAVGADSSDVVISKISDTKVKISNIILSGYTEDVVGAANAYIVADFNPSTQMLEIPAQYVMTSDGKDAAYSEDPDGHKYFCYFQPGFTYYTQGKSGYYSYLYEPKTNIGLAYNEYGFLGFTQTKVNTDYAPDGYEIQFYEADGQGGFAQGNYSLYCTYGGLGKLPAYFIPQGIIPQSAAQVKKSIKDANLKLNK